MQSALRARRSLASWLQSSRKSLASHSRGVSNTRPNRSSQGRECSHKGSKIDRQRVKNRANIVQGDPRSAPRATKSPPRASKTVPRATKSAQERPKSAPRAPKSAPTAPKSAPRAPKSARRIPQERAKSAPRAPKSAPRAPRRAFRTHSVARLGREARSERFSLEFLIVRARADIWKTGKNHRFYIGFCGFFVRRLLFERVGPLDRKAIKKSPKSTLWGTKNRPKFDQNRSSERFSSHFGRPSQSKSPLRAILGRLGRPKRPVGATGERLARRLGPIEASGEATWCARAFGTPNSLAVISLLI